ncbi:MAG: small multi-drug export protein [Rubrivivax sp.]|nr:small multi-drug export protein [Rubrivivax sp.]
MSKPHRAAPDPVAPAATGSNLHWRQLLASTEGRLLATGLGMVMAILAAIGLGLMMAPTATLDFAAVIGLNLVIGRAAGMSYGLASGLGRLDLVLCNLLVETAQVLVLYPLFVLGWQQLIDTRRLQPLLKRLQAAAESGGGGVRRFGIAGLFVFVFMPFWMTGPVVGAIIGFLLGLRTAVNLAVVLSATGLAILVYAQFLEQVDAWATAAHPYAVFIVIVALAALVWALRRWLRRRQA